MPAKPTWCQRLVDALRVPQGEVVRPSRVLTEAEFARAARAASSDPGPATLRRAIAAGYAVLDVLSPGERRFIIALLHIASLQGLLGPLVEDGDKWRPWTVLPVRYLDGIEPGERRDAVVAHARAAALKSVATYGDLGRDAAIDALEHARHLSVDAEVDAVDLIALARLRLARYRDRRQPLDLEASIEAAGMAAQIEGAPPAMHDLAMETAADALSLRADATNSVDDLAVAIGLAEALLDKVEHPSSSLCLRVKELTAHLSRKKFGLTHDPADLARAIALREDLLAASRNPSERAGTLDNLGNLYSDRYQLLHEKEDLDAAIQHSGDALSLVPPSDPARSRMFANQALSLHDRFILARDETDSQQALASFRRGLDQTDLSTEMTLRLRLGLGRHLLLRSVLLGRGDDLDAAITEFRLALSLALADEAALPVAYRLRLRSKADDISDLLTGALVRRGRLPGNGCPVADLAEALAVAEAAKSPLLVRTLSQRTRATDPDSEDGFVEAMYLSLLTALDSAELSYLGTGSEPKDKMHLMRRRRTALGVLHELWARGAADSAETAERVKRLTYPVSLVREGIRGHDSLDTLVALCRYEDYDETGRSYRGQCAFLVPSGTDEPELLYADAGDPLPAATARLSQEIAADAGRGVLVESWHHELARRLSPRTVPASGVLVISPPSTGAGIPWALALERCGWRTSNGSPPAVFTVPSLAVLTLPEPNLRAHTPLDMAELLGDRRSAGEGGPAKPSGGLLQYAANADGDAPPVVIGNPTSDLPASAREAAAIASILDVDPLLGDQATVDATIGLLSASSVAHIAAHAIFVADEPLRARILLADGELPASRLVGNSSQARLVVLSACEAGKGATLVGTEVLGLMAALTRTGVGAVVASMWSVDDAATAYLMKSFHSLVDDGLEPADALARAQARVRQESGWSAPYFWAGFVVSGRTIRRERMTSA